jgi:hypothetical protein
MTHLASLAGPLACIAWGLLLADMVGVQVGAGLDRLASAFAHAAALLVP